MQPSRIVELSWELDLQIKVHSPGIIKISQGGIDHGIQWNRYIAFQRRLEVGLSQGRFVGKTGTSSGKQGGSHEQHVKAGEQSHKNSK